MTGRWWRRDALQDRRPHLDARIRARRAVRAFFDDRGFEEVETPALQVSPGLEPHLAAFETTLLPPGRARGSGRRLYLHTSPEFAMKKLLAGGLEQIWQLSPVYRNAEGSPTHHPEFRMLEWYRANAGYEMLMEDCEALLQAVAEACGVRRLRWRSVESDPFGAWRRLSVVEAFAQYADIDLRAAWASDPADPPAGPLAAEAARIGVRTAPDDRWDDVFFRIFAERVEPHLGAPTPVLLHDYPVCMAALARPKPSDPALAERVELYVAGLELANGFGELTDAAEQRRRFEADMALKERLYGERYPIDGDFLAAVAEMPPAAGMALGFDRLVMLASGAEDICDTLWAPVDGAGAE